MVSLIELALYNLHQKYGIMLNCEVKEIQPEFGIVETILVTNKKLVFEKEHLERLKRSAAFFSFPLLKGLWNIQPECENCILRLVVYKNGNFDLKYLPLSPPKSNLVTVSDVILDSSNVFLYHKTTYRPWYKEAMREIESGRYYDVLFCNKQGELCEGARSNLFIEIDGIFYTPSLASGLLNGILRQNLIETQKATETKITPELLQKAEAIYCGNSVRGLAQVKLLDK
ncbi:MAG: aminotransferase class IV [Leptospiraceae bacterium]|nr:aminotransferase class IV [Leptospiraceae bacterium]